MNNRSQTYSICIAALVVSTFPLYAQSVVKTANVMGLIGQVGEWASQQFASAGQYPDGKTFGSWSVR
jgi:hypothetical protein